MSDTVSYVSEPATFGKVLLHTTIGDLDIELFSHQAPLACRNFVQHCLDGYYDGCIFHRVIKGFMAQTGDPLGNGLGGVSAFEGGKEFVDEFHSRLKFTRRGLLGMASNGKHTNRSQFFITLGPCEFLNNRHTLWGKLTGTTLFNIQRFEELEIENVGGTSSGGDGGESEVGRDRPFNPPKITSIEVLVNPFDDIKPRMKQVELKKKEGEDRPKKKQKKNLTLLSFGDEEALEEQRLTSSSIGTGGAAHDLTDDSRLSKKSIDEIQKTKMTVEDENDQTTLQSVKDALKKKKSIPSSSMDEVDDEHMDEATYDAHMRAKLIGHKMPKRIDDPHQPPTTSKVDTPIDSQSIRSEYDRLKADMGLGGSSIKSSPAIRLPKDDINTTTTTLLTPLEALRSKYKTRKANTALQGREQETLKKLGLFQQKLSSNERMLDTKPQSFETIDTNSTRMIPPVPLRKEELEDGGGEDGGGGGGTDWLAHQVRFSRRPQDFDPMARDVEGMDYAVQDPRGEDGARSLSSSFRASGGVVGSRRRGVPTGAVGRVGMGGLSIPTAKDFQGRQKDSAELDAEEENQRVVERLLEEDRQRRNHEDEDGNKKRRRSRSRSRSRSRNRSPSQTR